MTNATRVVHPQKRNNLLVAGNVSNEQFELLIELSSICSSKMIMALREHLVDGISRKDACEHFGANVGYFSVVLGRLFHVNQVVSQLTSYYRD